MRLSREARKRIGAGIGALAFLLLFGGIGLIALWAVLGTIHDGKRAESWTRVPATITHVDTGQVRYNYDWQGKRFAGDRAGSFVLGGVSSELDDWEDRMEASINDAMAGKSQAKVYVNPSDPSESMLDREIRWKLLAAFLPFAVGFTAGGLFTGVMIGRRALGIRQHGAGVPLLKPRAREALTQWAIGLVWSSVAIPVALIALPDLAASGEWFPVILLVIFPLFGLLILWNALASTLRVFRDGSPFNARTAT